MKAPTKGIVVDGSTRGNPGPSQYRGIDLETGTILFNIDIGIATNNITEFLALCHAILYCVNSNISTDIYSDSQTGLSWIKYRKVNSSLPISPKTEKARDFVKRAETKLKDLEIKFDGIDLVVNNSINVCKWYSSEYGEIPADYGFKK